MIPPRLSVALTTLALSLLAASDPRGGPSPTSKPATGTLRISSDTPLPASLKHANDVRWADDTAVYLAVPRNGVVRVPVAAPEGQVVQETTDGRGLDNSWGTTFVAVTPKYLVFGAQVFLHGWKELGASRIQHLSPFFEAIEDFDAFDDHYAALGLHRGSDGKMSKDGTIVWVGRLGPDPPDPQPLLVTRSDASSPIANCMGFLASGVRYLPDGSLVVVPGVENGAYHYDLNGKLIGFWNTDTLGIGVDCTFSRERASFLAKDFPARLIYLNRYRTVDEILILDGIPTLVTRRIEAGGTRWQLVTLEPDGGTSQRDLPLSSTSDLAHVRGDTRDGRTVLLVYDWAMYMPDDEVRKKAEPTRLVLLEKSAEASRAPVEGVAGVEGAP